VIVVAAGEVAIGLAIVLALYRNRDTVYVDEASMMRW
ncbi:MAG: NADH-quinone oxidoreductase subunit K, partial [Myxococcota bacterium]